MTMPQIAGPLAAALDVVAEGCADLADPWWVFGSAGMAISENRTMDHLRLYAADFSHGCRTAAS